VYLAQKFNGATLDGEALLETGKRLLNCWRKRKIAIQKIVYCPKSVKTMFSIAVRKRDINDGSYPWYQKKRTVGSTFIQQLRGIELSRHYNCSPIELEPQ
jgi:hypothetical protein